MITLISGTNRKGSESEKFAKHIFQVLKQKTKEEVKYFSLVDLPLEMFHTEMYSEATQSKDLAKIQDDCMIPAEKFSRYRVGFFKNKVMIETHNGKFISAPYDEVKWTERMFMVNEWMIPIGNPSQSIFPYEKLVKKLMPYVKPANKLKAIDAFKLQWKSPEGMLKYGVALMVMMTILVLFLEKNKILAFFSGFI